MRIVVVDDRPLKHLRARTCCGLQDGVREPPREQRLPRPEPEGASKWIIVGLSMRGTMPTQQLLVLLK